jgi:hypothetical protein
MHKRQKRPVNAPESTTSLSSLSKHQAPQTWKLSCWHLESEDKRKPLSVGSFFSAVDRWRPFAIGASSAVACPSHQKVILFGKQRDTMLVDHHVQQRLTTTFDVAHCSLPLKLALAPARSTPLGCFLSVSTAVLEHSTPATQLIPQERPEKRAAILDAQAAKDNATWQQVHWTGSPCMKAHRSASCPILMSANPSRPSICRC